MKRINRSLIVLLCICLFVCACKKDEPTKPIELEISEEEKIINNLASENIGTINVHFKNRYSLVKITNRNDKDVYVDVRYTYYNNGNQVDIDDDYIYIAAGKTVYSISKRDAEDPDFSSYSYETIYINEANGYSDIFNNLKVSYSKNSNNIGVTISNDGNRVTTAEAIILYYSGNKIVSVGESIEYDLLPHSVKTSSIDFPRRDEKNLIPFDRVEVFINEASLKI